MPLPERDALLELMDLNWREMCRECIRATPGGWVVERDGLLVCGSPRGSMATNMAIVTAPVSARSVRAETDRLFRAAGLSFSVWTRAHRDAALEEELAAAGFVEMHREPGMAWAPGDGAPPRCPRELTIRPVVDDAGREAYARVVAEAFAVYGTPPESTRSHFASLPSLVGPAVQGFLGWRDGVAVSAATLCLSHGVGGIAWVGTCDDARGRGYGAAVTWAVIEAGLRRGARFMNLQASPMGAPMYRRMGFSTPTHYVLFAAPD